MNRRDFLLRASLATGAVALGNPLFSRMARAADDTDHYFVFCYFEGGWDQLLALDPRDPAVFTEDRARETGIDPAYRMLPQRFSRAPIDAGPFQLGPAVGELAELAEAFSVVRGVNMGTLTHEVGRRFFITGRPPSGLQARGSSIATVATSQLGADRPVPHLAHRVESYNEAEPAYATALQVGAVGTLQYVLQEDLGIPTGIRPNVKGALGAYWEKRAAALDCATEDAAGGSHQAALYRANRERARVMVGVRDEEARRLYEYFRFEDGGNAEVRQRYGFGPGQQESPYGRAALASQAIKTGLSRVVSVVLGDNLDTHDGSWANDQSARLEAGFNALARLIRDLRDSEAPGGGSFLDKTTIVAFSEFARTPRLNARNGRDHHLANSALLCGAGIRGGLAYGASSDNGMGSTLVDLATGAPDEGGRNIGPDHVMSTLLAAGGLDYSVMRSEPLQGLLTT